MPEFRRCRQRPSERERLVRATRVVVQFHSPDNNRPATRRCKKTGAAKKTTLSHHQLPLLRQETFLPPHPDRHFPKKNSHRTFGANFRHRNKGDEQKSFTNRSAEHAAMRNLVWQKPWTWKPHRKHNNRVNFCRKKNTNFPLQNKSGDFSPTFCFLQDFCLTVFQLQDLSRFPYFTKRIVHFILHKNNTNMNIINR